MSRRRTIQKKEVLGDYKYGSTVVSKFINTLMLDGKKSVAESIFYKAVEILESKVGKDGFESFNEVLEQVKPRLEVRSRRVGGATYQVPVDVRPVRAQALAIRWIISCAKARSEKNMTDKLANEFIDVVNQRGASLKKRDDTHRMAEANRAFAHYRW